MHSIGREAAIELAESGWWEGKSPREICDVQLFTQELCCPFEVFHQALGKAMQRPVFSHEIGCQNWDRLVSEYLGERSAPTLEEILNLFPPHVQVIAVVR